MGGFHTRHGERASHSAPEHSGRMLKHPRELSENTPTQASPQTNYLIICGGEAWAGVFLSKLAKRFCGEELKRVLSLADRARSLEQPWVYRGRAHQKCQLSTMRHLCFGRCSSCLSGARAGLESRKERLPRRYECWVGWPGIHLPQSLIPGNRIKTHIFQLLPAQLAGWLACGEG